MDSVRFGRVLGIGARSAAKALTGALTGTVDAAMAANPRASAARATVRATVRATDQATRQVKETRRGVVRGGKRFGAAVWGPLAKLSGVLWLEMTGAFFGIFAMFAGQAAWTHRAELVGTAGVGRDARVRAAVFVGMAVVFGYFCVSSFVRARRRARSG